MDPQRGKSTAPLSLPPGPARRPRRLLACVAPALALVVGAGCSMREVSVEVGGTHLRSVALANYERAGGERLERLLDLLATGAPAPAPTGSKTATDESGPTPSPPPAEGSVALGLDLALMTEVEGADGRRVLAAVEDGDTLLDGFGRLGDGDGVKLSVQTTTECTVYVILVDASARPRTLFPNSSWSTEGNPLQPGRPYRLPQGNVLFELGQTRGVETLYVVVSSEPWPELEALLAEVGAAAWDRLPTPAVVTRASLIRRGVARVASSSAHAVGGPSGTLSDVPSELYLGEPGERMVVTRWFWHE